jgi:hypothetical protein
MKKIRLNVAELDATEILSRDQLKAVFGGSDSGSNSATQSCGSDDCKTAHGGLGCNVGESCSYDYNLAACACKKNLA